MTKSDEAAVVELEDVAFTWPGAAGFGIAIDDFRLARGSRTLLLGPSGSGKSTLLSLLCGIAAPQRGAIRLLGEDIAQMSGAARDRFRAEHIGIIFQMFNLLPYGSVIDNVVLPLNFARVRRERAQRSGTIEKEAERLLADLGLGPALCEGPASALSVGQQQRVAVGRALIGSPEIIVADEPTSALDKVSQARFLELLFGQISEEETTLIMVTHDETLAEQFDRVVQLSDILRPTTPAVAKEAAA